MQTVNLDKLPPQARTELLDFFSGDNGRVLGYDAAHNYHHKHYFGEVLEVEFISFQNTLEKFEQENHCP